MNLTNLWQEFLTIIKEEVGSRVVETWFKSVTFSHWDAYTKTASLCMPNAFIKDWIISNYQPLLKRHLGRLLHEVEFKILFLDESKQEIVEPAEVLEGIPQPIPAIRIEEQKKNTLPLSINSTYRFDNFIVGSHNELVYATALAVCDNPGHLYNPFIIHGSSGLGKTHLAHAIAYQIKLQNTNKKVLIQSADRFVSEFIHAVRFDKIAHFDHKYRNIDILIMDDIQYIANKEQTQEAFFQLFNTLYESRKQIICTSSCLPKDIKGLSDRLLSRLQSGLITDIDIPDLSSKIAIAKQKAQMHNMELTAETIETIAALSNNNIRDLEGILIRAIAFSTLTKQPITAQLIQKMVAGNALTGKRTIAPDLNKIVQRVSHHFVCSLEDIRSDKRHKQVTLARHVLMYLIKKFTEKSLTDIALFLKRKDHTTVLHALKKIDQYKKSSSDFLAQLRVLEQELA